jgi:hypothetical protein
MSCYTRHLDEVLDMLGWEHSEANKKRLDREIRTAFSMEEKPCNEVWTRIKEITNNRSDLSKLVEIIDTTAET